MIIYKFNFSKLLNSAVLTLFLLSSSSAFAAGGGEEEKPSTPAIQMKAPSSLPSPELEVTPPPSSLAAPSASAVPSPEEQRLQSLQRQLEIAQLERKIAEEQAATRAATLLAQPAPFAQQTAFVDTPLYSLLAGGRPKERVQRNLNRTLGKEFGGVFGAFLGLPPR